MSADLLHINHILGVIPKAVMDSMEYFVNFHQPKDVFKKGNRKRHSLKGKICTLTTQILFGKLDLKFLFTLSVKGSVKTMPWIHSKPKVRSVASDPTLNSLVGDGPKLRRSLGLQTFPNVQLFRTCMPNAGKHAFNIEVCFKQEVLTHTCF